MHATHAVAPSAAWYSPSVHGEQLSISVCALNVPGAQRLAFALPTEQYVPSGHTTHSSALLITVSDAFWWRPAGHGSAADAPSAQ